jgi:transcriptional regulator with XRE-family HTH domain
MHHGKLVAQYREQMGMTQEELAAEMHVHVRTVQKLESRPMIRSIARRWFLVGLLGIPASQLGLKGEPPWSQKNFFPINNDTMGFFEHEMALRWRIYQTSGASFSRQGLDIWMSQVRSFMEASQGTPWHNRALTVLSMSYQLEGSVLRDAKVYSQAHIVLQDAFQAAKESENTELLAAALLREGMVSMAQEQPAEALQRFNGALHYIKDQGFPRLRGKLLQARAEAYALIQRPQDCWASIGLAEHILGREEQRHEQSQAIFNASSVTLWKGLYALLLHDYERAIILFDIVLAAEDHTFASNRARFLARKAEAYYGAEKIGECIDVAQEALTMASSINQKNTIERVSTLHTVLSQSRWNKEQGVRRLAASLAQHYYEK